MLPARYPSLLSPLRYNLPMSTYIRVIAVLTAVIALMSIPAPAQTAMTGVWAISQAQLETIHYMAHVYLKQIGRYPKNLQELRNSPFWVVDVFNSYTLLQIQQIPFTPREQDFSKSDALPHGGVFAQLEEDAGQQQQNGNAGPPPIQGSGGAPGMGMTSVQGRRIEPSRIQFATPGDLIYWQDGDSLQMLIFDENGQCSELWIASPFNYRASALKVTEKVRPQSDFLVAESATHLELMLPAMYSRFLYMSDQRGLTPAEMDKRIPVEFEKMAAKLGLQYINPIKKRPFMRANYYSPGDLSTAPWLTEASLLYFLEANRARSLDELTDERTFRERSKAIQRRDKLVASHAGEMPAKPPKE